MTDAISQFSSSPQVNNPVRNAQDKNSPSNSTQNSAVGAPPAPASTANVSSANLNASGSSDANAVLNEANTAASTGADSVILSSAAQVVAQPGKVSTDNVFDRNKVDSIKTAIKNGQYVIDPSKIAQSFWSIEQMIHG